MICNHFHALTHSICPSARAKTAIHKSQIIWNPFGWTEKCLLSNWCASTLIQPGSLDGAIVCTFQFRGRLICSASPQHHRKSEEKHTRTVSYLSFPLVFCSRFLEFYYYFPFQELGRKWNSLFGFIFLHSPIRLPHTHTHNTQAHTKYFCNKLRRFN